MLALVTVCEQHPDGSVTSGSGKLLWTPDPPPGLTRVVSVHDSAAPSAATSSIANQDAFVCLSKPSCFDMPDAILAIIAAEPTGEIAEMYRGYVRHTLMPLCRRLANTLQEYAAYLELPPKDWLETTFPEMSWRSYTNFIFVQHWFTYTLSFERILAEWSEANFKSIRPGAVLPLGAMIRTVAWSQERAEAKQAELIGMTTVAEVDDSLFTRVEGAKTTFETEE